MCDPDGYYPTDEELDAIRAHEGTAASFLDVVKAAWPGDFGTITETRLPGGDNTEVKFVTGGWSGCEDVLQTVRSTMFGILFWSSSSRGGLHVFVVPDAQTNFHLPALPAPAGSPGTADAGNHTSDAVTAAKGTAAALADQEWPKSVDSASWATKATPREHRFWVLGYRSGVNGGIAALTHQGTPNNPTAGDASHA